MLRRGQVVLSLAGRDKDRLMAVLGEAPDGGVLVADGKERPLQRPKAEKSASSAADRRPGRRAFNGDQS